MKKQYSLTPRQKAQTRNLSIISFYSYQQLTPVFQV